MQTLTIDPNTREWLQAVLRTDSSKILSFYFGQSDPNNESLARELLNSQNISNQIIVSPADLQRCDWLITDSSGFNKLIDTTQNFPVHQCLIINGYPVKESTLKRLFDQYLHLRSVVTLHSARPYTTVLGLTLSERKVKGFESRTLFNPIAGRSLSLKGTPTPVNIPGHLYLLSENGQSIDTGILVKLNPKRELALVRYRESLPLPDGTLLFARDVEQAILACPGVKDASVLIRPDSSGSSRLFAFISLNGNSSVEAVKAFLSGSLSPTAISELEWSVLNNLPIKDRQIDVRVLEQMPVPDSVLPVEIRQQFFAGSDQTMAMISQARPPKNDLLEINLTPTDEGIPNSVPADEEDHLPDALADGGELAFSSREPLWLGDLLSTTASKFPHHGVRYIEALDHEYFETYQQLLDRAMQTGASLAEQGARQGDYVLMQTGTLQSTITLFWACHLGGFIAVPLAYPKSFTAENEQIKKLKNVLKVLKKTWIVGDDGFELHWSQAGLDRTAFTFLNYKNLKQSSSTLSLPEKDPGKVAVLLFTSGSTGLPKGVQLTHSNIIARSKSSSLLNGFGPDDVSLNWMPLDHVGGIIMYHTKSVFNGCQQVLGLTELVISDPALWLVWMSKYKVTDTWAPNFAFAMIGESHLEGIGEIDLSPVTHILNGGEAISYPVAKKFLDTLAPYKLNLHSIFPAYGMSETTSGITHSLCFDGKGGGVATVLKNSMKHTLRFSSTNGSETARFVEVGTVIPGVKIRITDETNRLIKERQIGRVQVSGWTVNAGYLNNSEANQAFLGEGWFNTGDLGFLHEGRLTITGREKDVIIINGINYYNYEIEQVAETAQGVKSNGTIAIGKYNFDTGSEELFLFFVTEVPFTEETTKKAILNILTRQAAITPRALIPIPYEQFPVTDSGKKQRNQLLARLEKGDFETWIPSDSRSKNKETLPSWFYTREWVERSVASVPFRSDRTFLFLVPEADGKNIEAAVPATLGSAKYLSYNHLDKQQLQVDSSFCQKLDQFLQTDPVIVLFTPCLKQVSPINPGYVSDETGIGFFAALLAVLQSSERVTTDMVVVTRENGYASGYHQGWEGLIRTACAEHAWLNARLVSIDFREMTCIRDLCRELTQGQAYPEVRLRREKRYISQIQPLDVITNTESAIQKNGFYIITGGLGGVGFELSKYLLLHYQVRLLLIGKTDPEAPSSETGEQVLIPIQNRKEKRLKALQTLRSLGQVIMIRAELSNKSELSQAVRTGIDKFGQQPDGILHLAGEGNLEYHWQHAGEHVLINENASTFSVMFQPKADGTLFLAEIVQQLGIKQFISFSSTTALFGSNGFGAYSAANAVQQGIMDQLDRTDGQIIKTLSWSQWDNIGMSSNNPYAALSEEVGFGIIPPEAGLASFELALRQPAQHIQIGLNREKTTILQEMPFSHNEQWLGIGYSGEILPSNLSDELTLSLKRKGFTPELIHFETLPIQLSPADFVVLGNQPAVHQPGNETEHKLMAIWEKVLGQSGFGVFDNFFELGGHSIKATQLSARITEQFERKIGLQEIFNAPTIRQLAQLIGHTDHQSTGQWIPRAPIMDHYPVSASQYRTWVLHKMVRKSVAYNIPAAIEIKGPLQVEAFRSAISQVIRRHEILRTVFIEVEGEPRQKILEFEPDILLIDKDDSDNSQHPIEDEIRRLSHQQLDVENGPLVQFRIWRFNSHRFIAFFNIHHIVADGTTIHLIFKEITEIYQAAIQQHPSGLPEPDIQFKDYSVWQQQNLRESETDAQYWRSRLSGHLGTFNLPADFDRPEKHTYEGNIYKYAIDKDLTEQLSHLSGENGCSLFMVFVATLSLYIHKLTDETDVILGTGADMRSSVQLENQMGQYINLLALRNRIDPKRPFNELLDQVRITVSEAVDHQNYPYERIIEEVATQRDMSRSPLFNVQIIMQNYRQVPLSIDGLEITKLQVPFEASKFDCTFSFRETGTDIESIIRYNTDLFTRKRVELMARQMLVLLRQVAENPGQPLSSFRINTSDEQEWTDSFTHPITEIDYQPVQEQFRDIALKNPGIIALEMGSEQMTYHEALRFAQQIGQFISTTYSEARVIALWFSSGIEFVCSMAGVLFSDRVFMPIDSGFPPKRQQSMLKACRPDLILCLPDDMTRVLDVAGNVSSETGLATVSFEYHMPVVEEILPMTGHSPHNRQESWSYVYFTSGTTGEPKAIAGKGNSLSHFIAWEKTMVSTRQPLRIAQLTQMTFDASLRDIWMALTSGSTLCIPEKQVKNDLGQLFDWFNQQRIDLIHTVPSMLTAITAVAGHKHLSQVRYLLLAGEPVSNNDILNWSQHLSPRAQLFNLYGATETTLVKTCKLLRPEDARQGKKVSVGSPISGTQMIIARDQRPCATGETGTVYIRTPYKSLGYLNNPEQNRKAFVQNPLHNEYSDLVYLTGDLGRYNLEHETEILGRIDQQVKINGVRIEPEEIEQVLERAGAHEVVVVPDDWQKPHALYCFYTTRKPELTPDRLQTIAQELLPVFMVPSKFELLTHLPLNANGKIDKKDLKLSETEEKPDTQNDIDSDQLKAVRKIFEDVLGTTIQSEKQSFFELGGNSLSAMILLSILHQRFNVRMAIDQFFKSPNIQAVGKLISQAAQETFKAIESLPDAPDYQVSHAQKRMWLLQEIEKEAITYNVKRAFLLEGELKTDILKEAIDRIISRHQSLRTSFVHTGSNLRQIIHQSDAMPAYFDVLDFSEYNDADEKALSYVTSLFGHVFDLSKPPLILFKIIKTDSNKHVFALVMHHIISDGWSMEVLSKEIIEGYNTLLDHPDFQPGSLGIQYRDYAAWQNNLLAGEAIEEHRSYWLSQFEGEIPVLNLPTDFPRFRIKTFNGDLFKFTIGNTSYKPFRALCDREGCTLFMGLLAAFKVLIYRYTGQTDLINGTPIAGRDYEGLQDQIGFYVNTLAIRNKLVPGSSFLEVLADVKEKTISAYKYQAYPFDRLVDDLDPERYTNHSPLFDVVVQQMNVLDDKKEERQLRGITIHDFKPKWQTSQFDLSVFFTELKDSISAVIEFNTDLFVKERIDWLSRHFVSLLQQITENPFGNIDFYQLVDSEEAKFLIDQFNTTRCDFPRQSTLVNLFAQQALGHSGRTALITNQGNLSYAELDQLSDQIAAQLKYHHIGPGANVALLLEPGYRTIASMLGVLKSGNAYVPISGAYPRDRIMFIINDAEASCLISEQHYLKILNEAVWDIPCTRLGICLDTNDYFSLTESDNHMMNPELWDHVGRNASDDITGGAWFSSFSGQPLSRAEMDEYAENIVSKLRPYLSPSTRILEIGCSSGISMFRIAPEVQSYLGTDISAEILKTTQARIRQANLHQAELKVLPAHRIDELDGPFDLIIINSVAQCFSGYNYLTSVIRKALQLLAPGGIIFLGDIQDAGRKEQLITDLESYLRNHPDAQTKLDWSNEFFISKTFLQNVHHILPEAGRIEITNKIGNLENELTRYRYDCLIFKDSTPTKVSEIKKTVCGFDPNLPKLQPPVDGSPDDVAYLIYTSGSTGQPKGCRVTHRNLVRLFKNERFMFRFDQNDVWIQAHGSHFDFSVWEIYGALLYGGTLVIPDSNQIRQPSELYALIRENRISVLNQTPLAFQYLSEHILDSDVHHNLSEHLRYVIFGGDKLLPSTLSKWSKRFPLESTRLINMYGITETTVHVSYYEVSQEDIDSKQALSPIGVPLPETEVYVIDQHRRLLPRGIIGELAVSGSGVCLGYQNRDDLTRERFIDNPFRPGETMYLSGDLGMVDFSGKLLYIGRKDHQVKIRGYRIELSEIEKQLLKVPGIKEGTIICRQNKSGENYIAAYYVAEDLDRKFIAGRMKQYLPDYMIPASWCEMDALPLTISGKLDRSRLPDPEHGSAERSIMKAETETEAAVMALYQEVMGLSQVSVYDNFFEIGGNSLKTMSLMSLIHARLRIGVPLAVIYQGPSPKEVANYIDCARYMNIQYKEHPYLLLGDKTKAGNLFLFPPALGSALAYSHLAELLETAKLYSFNYVDNNTTLERYVQLFNELQPEGSFTLAGHSAGGFMAFHMAKALEKAGRKVDAVIILDAFREHKEGKFHSYETIMEGVDLYMEAKFEEFENTFIDMNFFKEVCYKQVIDYYNYLYHAERESTPIINAPIHFLIAENHYDREENWSVATRGGVTTYYAKGVHGKMVEEPWVRENAQLFDKIIKTVKHN